MNLLRKKWSLLAVACILIVGSSVSLAAVSAAKPDDRAGAKTRTSVRAADLTSMFSVLRQAPASSIPSLVKEFASSQAGDDYGLNVAETRVVKPADGTATWYVIPGSKGLCFYTDHVGGCTSLANAAAGKLFLVGVDFGEPDDPKPPVASKVIGVVPDDVVAVSAADASGRAARAVKQTVKQNVYRLTGAAVSSLRLTRSAGVVETVTLGG